MTIIKNHFEVFLKINTEKERSVRQNDIAELNKKIRYCFKVNNKNNRFFLQWPSKYGLPIRTRTRRVGISNLNISIFLFDTVRI
jgi:hypothetical protein